MSANASSRPPSVGVDLEFRKRKAKVILLIKLRGYAAFYKTVDQDESWQPAFITRYMLVRIEIANNSNF